MVIKPDALAELTDSFVDRCLDEPKAKAFATMGSLVGS